MKPVNLLPDGDRQRPVTPVSPNAHKVVLGGLVVVLLAAVVYVFTLNQITENKDSLARAEQETQAAQVQVDALEPYGRFSQIKSTRLASVTSLAKVRFDWERLMRETALVIPSGVWITQMDAATSGTPGGSDTSTTAPGAGQPSATIMGCAKTQSAVATTMVRLRSLHRAQDVTLDESGDANGGSAGGSGSDSGGTATGGDCGRYYPFKTTITFGTESDTPQDGDRKRVPSTLGGGA